LEFYASQDNWQRTSPSVRAYDYDVVDKSDLGSGDFEIDEFTNDKGVGGLAARVALAKIKEMEK